MLLELRINLRTNSGVEFVPNGSCGVCYSDVVVSFVANPIFKNLGVVDAKVVDAATKDLNNLIDLSDEIKREAKTLGKSAKK